MVVHRVEQVRSSISALEILSEMDQTFAPNRRTYFRNDVLDTSQVTIALDTDVHFRFIEVLSKDSPHSSGNVLTLRCVNYSRYRLKERGSALWQVHVLIRSKRIQNPSRTLRAERSGRSSCTSVSSVRVGCDSNIVSGSTLQ